jgi:hypothetical protein
MNAETLTRLATLATLSLGALGERAALVKRNKRRSSSIDHTSSFFPEPFAHFPAGALAMKG